MVREPQPGISITGQSDRRGLGSVETSRSNTPSYPQTQALVNTSRNQWPRGVVPRLKPTLPACPHTITQSHAGFKTFFFFSVTFFFPKPLPLSPVQLATRVSLFLLLYHQHCCRGDVLISSSLLDRTFFLFYIYIFFLSLPYLNFLSNIMASGTRGSPLSMFLSRDDRSVITYLTFPVLHFLLEHVCFQKRFPNISSFFSFPLHL